MNKLLGPMSEDFLFILALILFSIPIAIIIGIVQKRKKNL